MDPRNSKVQFSWFGSDKVSELEREKKNTQCDRNIERKERRPGEDDDMLGGVVALGDVPTDSEWHVVFSSRSQASAAIPPCAHQCLLYPPGNLTAQENTTK